MINVDSGSKIFNDKGDIAVVLDALCDTDTLRSILGPIGSRLAAIYVCHSAIVEKKVPLPALRKGWARVQQELDFYSPQVKRVFVLGGTEAVKVIFPKIPKYAIQETHGTLFLLNGRVVVPTWQVRELRYINTRGKDTTALHLMEYFNQDMARLLRLERPDAPLSIQTWIPNHLTGTVVVDIETNAPINDTMTALGIQWSDTERAQITDPDQMQWALNVIADSPVENIVLHSAQYDMSFFSPEWRAKTYGRIRDTILMAKANGAGQGEAGLKNLCNRYTSRPGNYAWANETFSYDDPAYHAEDLEVTWRLFKLWGKQDKLVVEVMQRAASMCCEQTYLGSKVDTARLTTLAGDIDKDLAKQEPLLKAKYDCEDLNSNDVLVASLIRKGYTFKKATNGGKVAIDAEVLKDLGLPDIVEYRELRKLESTMLRKFNTLLRPDGTVPHHQNLMGTETGRTSMSEINWQQAYGIAKELLVSRFEGGSIGSVDLSQAEIRTGCYNSGDVEMAEWALMKDAHRVNASNAFQVLFEEVTDEQRFAAKAIIFRAMFGGQGITEPQKRVEVYAKSKFKRFFKWVEYARAKAMRTNEVTDAWGKRRDLKRKLTEAGKWAVGRCGINGPIQGLASHCAMWLTVRTWELLRDFKSLVLFGVHDSIVFDIYPGEEYNVLSALDTAFRELGVMLRSQFEIAKLLPLEGEFQVGANWYATKTGEKHHLTTAEVPVCLT